MFIIKITSDQVSEIAQEFIAEFGKRKVETRKSEYCLYIDTKDRERINKVIGKKNLPVFVEQK